jgi:hypothetical protein
MARRPKRDICAKKTKGGVRLGGTVSHAANLLVSSLRIQTVLRGLETAPTIERRRGAVGKAGANSV